MRFAKILFIPILLLLSSVASMAQDAAAGEAKTVQSSNNMLAFTMMLVAIVLACLVYAMGQVLITLSRQLLEKQRQSKSSSQQLLLVKIDNIHYRY